MENKIIKGDINKIINKIEKFDKVITSPPYNILRKRWKSEKYYQISSYDEHDDFSMTTTEYVEWLILILKKLEKKMNKNGAILWNMSYGTDHPEALFIFLGKIHSETNLMINEIIYWKKKNAMPNSATHNRMTRIVEPIFVISRKTESKTFTTNKKLKGYRKSGQKIYHNMFNFFEAKNNDGNSKVNPATFSEEMVGNIIERYIRSDDVVFDSFAGTGTTIVECSKRNIKAFGVELSEKQCNFANERIKKIEDKKRVKQIF